MCSFHAQNRRHRLLAYVRIILSQVRIDGCCVRVAKVTRDRARSLRLLPNPHRRGMANSVAMDHVLVQPSQARVPLDDDVQVMARQPAKQFRGATMQRQID